MTHSIIDNIKHFFTLLWFLLVTLWAVIRSRKTWIAVGVITFLYVYAWFFSNYTLQGPVKRIEWQCVVCKRGEVKPKKTTQAQTKVVEAKSTTEKPEEKPKTEYEIVHSQKWGEVLWKIYQLETQRGLTDFCRTKGQYGGFGVMNDKNKPHCYDTFTEATERASYWFEKLEPEKNLPGALCAWNTGTKNLVNCFYYQNYLLVK
jgi:hypothetical protein